MIIKENKDSAEVIAMKDRLMQKQAARRELAKTMAEDAEIDIIFNNRKKTTHIYVRPAREKSKATARREEKRRGKRLILPDKFRYFLLASSIIFALIGISVSIIGGSALYALISVAISGVYAIAGGFI